MMTLTRRDAGDDEARISEPTLILSHVSLHLVRRFTNNKHPALKMLKEMNMYRIVRVVASNGKAYEVPLTGEQADFFLRMAEFKAASNPTVTFNDLLAEKREKELQSKSKQRN
jgi:HJR/Mrr/RecB family endonuclease